MKTFFGLLTDFGFDFAVASIKGILLKSYPDAQIVDIDHSIEKFNILNAAFVIEKVHRFLPENMIFLCVVDPGVGTERDILCVNVDEQWFVGPNNGIFHYLFDKAMVKIYKIKQKEFAAESVTFHGRDIFAPAAVSLAKKDYTILQAIDDSDLIRIQNIGDTVNTGVVTYIDSFGNIKTNLLIQEYLTTESYATIMINQTPYRVKFTRTFLDAQPGELLCYKGSNATLEIAVNLGSAKQSLNAKIGDVILLNV